MISMHCFQITIHVRKEVMMYLLNTFVTNIS